MYHFKGFDSALVGDDMAQLESAVNDWLQQHRPQVRYMAQSARGEHFVVSFLFVDDDSLVDGPLHASLAPEMADDRVDDEDYDLPTSDDTGLPEAELPY